MKTTHQFFHSIENRSTWRCPYTNMVFPFTILYGFNITECTAPPYSVLIYNNTTWCCFTPQKSGPNVCLVLLFQGW